MHVLLLRPVPGNDRFGLGPFFRIEPLGLEYIAAALEMRGHRVTIADLRYSRSIDHLLRITRPGLVGIACTHALETDACWPWSSTSDAPPFLTRMLLRTQRMLRPEPYLREHQLAEPERSVRDLCSVRL
jgi:hypothetical protein